MAALPSSGRARPVVKMPRIEANYLGLRLGVGEVAIQPLDVLGRLESQESGAAITPHPTLFHTGISLYIWMTVGCQS
jgi:hypothetical protein